MRILVDDDQTVLPIDAIRLFSADSAGAAAIKLQKCQGHVQSGGLRVQTAIDGNTTAPSDNGWAIAPQTGRDHSAAFSLEKPLEGVKNRTIELAIYQNFVGGQHSLGKFRISVTGGPPMDFGLPPNVAAVLAKDAKTRTDCGSSGFAWRAPQTRQGLSETAGGAHGRPTTGRRKTRT